LPNFLNIRDWLTAILVIAIGAILVSGGSSADPQAPAGLPGLPAPFFGTAVVGGGGRTVAVDSYGNVVDLRAPGPAGRALVAVSAERQAAGTVAAGEAMLARARFGGGRALPLWRADAVRQRYLPGSNVLRTVASVDEARVALVLVGGGELGCRAAGEVDLAAQPCRLSTERVGEAVWADRRWLADARPLGADAPQWAGAMYRRSLLVLRALTDRRTGAVAAGARDGWAYVWPRDAAAVAIALAEAGYRPEARRVARFLIDLELNAAARFRGTGAPVDGRSAQGDAAGWVAAAARAAGVEHRPAWEQTAVGQSPATELGWRDRADYQEGDSGDYLGNAIASTFADGTKTDVYRPESQEFEKAANLRYTERPAHRRGGDWVASAFETPRGLVRTAGDPGSGLDSTAAWTVRPFPLPALFPAARRTLLRLVAQRESRFGIVPSENWHGGDDPWTAPTAWTAWSLAALANIERRPGPGVGADFRRKRHSGGRPDTMALRDRRAALHLMADLRRAATPLGLLPERVDAGTGLPSSTTPLTWSHAFAILALRELWPGRART
jgi:hypothetical protein